MYAKLFASLYQGTLRGDSHGILVFTNLLAHCDSKGFSDIHPRAIAEEVGLTVEEVKAALLTLEKPDPESRSAEEEGRRIVRMDDHRDWGWRVVNFPKYRAIRSEDDRREQNRLAQERFRQKHADSNESKPRKPRSAQAEAEAEAEAKNTCAVDTAPHGFNEFWEVWPKSPRKVGKAACLKKWVSHGLGAKAPEIVAHVNALKTSEQWRSGFDPAPLTYINQRRWEDGPVEAATHERRLAI